MAPEGGEVPAALSRKLPSVIMVAGGRQVGGPVVNAALQEPQRVESPVGDGARPGKNGSGSHCGRHFLRRVGWTVAEHTGTDDAPRKGGNGRGCGGDRERPLMCPSPVKVKRGEAG